MVAGASSEYTQRVQLVHFANLLTQKHKSQKSQRNDEMTDFQEIMCFKILNMLLNNHQ